MDLAVHTELAHTAGNELSVLGTEVENQNPVGMNISAVDGLHIPFYALAENG